MKKLDNLAGSHGNYQSAKKVENVLNYVVKDNEWISFPENLPLEELKNAFGVNWKNKISKSDLVTQMISNGATLKDVNAAHPGFTMMNLVKIQNYLEWKKSTTMIQETIPFPTPSSPVQGLDQPHLDILNWIVAQVENLNQMEKVQVPAVNNGIFITGPSNIGKSHFLNEIQRYFRCYFIPMDEDFYDLYEDGKYDLMVMDEFKHQKKIQWLNRLIDGTPVSLRKKGGQIMKIAPIPVMILSNYLLEECYPKIYRDNPGIFTTIQRRLIQVSFHGIDIDKIDFYFYKKYDQNDSTVNVEESNDLGTQDSE